MKKIISFSLWGTNPKYVVGAIKNSIIADELFPGWICRFYVGQSTIKGTPQIIDQLVKMKNVEVIPMPFEGDWTGMFWRFYAFSDENASIIISRDTDSRLTKREKVAVDEWLSSDKNFHIMRDHPYHSRKILGGMWGGRNFNLLNMKTLIQNFTIGNYYQIDQDFLEEVIYPLVKDSVFIHDEFNDEAIIKFRRKNYGFIGEVFDENDIRDPHHWKEIRKHRYKNLYAIKNKILKMLHSFNLNK